jgi:hypothetical protein
MNPLDLLVLLLLVGALIGGFFAGIVRVLVLIVTFYLSVVLASLYFASGGEMLVAQAGLQRFVAQYVAFILVLLAAQLLLAISGLYTFRYTRMPAQYDLIDRAAGTLFGVIWMLLAIGVISQLLWNMFILRGASQLDNSTLQAFGTLVADSRLTQIFATAMIQDLYGQIAPLLPDSARLLFVVQ